MAVLNLDFYQNVDSYSDGEIEDALLAYVKGELTWEQLEDREDRYPALYHLSPLRENILNWYPFRSGASVLEIGSGCGAITGLLCRKAARVVSVELSKRRASINYERYKSLDNLEIMVGNLNEMSFDNTFDYVVLNGVLEYAMSFTEGEKPYESFLKGIKGYLKQDGHLLIAIENRLGLKYFNGAPEDHTGHYYEGIDGYRDNRTVRTFSKAELSGLLDVCGLKGQTFYYPYPDYKFPTEIFTDQTILRYQYGKPFVNLDEKRYRIFEEQGVWNALTKDGVTASFANSFLVDAVEAAPSEKGASVEAADAGSREILYVKLSNDREEQFRIATSIERHMGEKIVVKRPLTEAAGAHIKTLTEGMELTPDPRFVNLGGILSENGSIYYPFLRSASLDSEIKEMIAAEDVDEILRTLRKVFREYGSGAKVSGRYQTEAFEKIFGPAKLAMDLPCVQPANIDLICDNIFRQGEEYRIIDCEWVFDMPVPLPFIIWRSVNELYTKHRSLSHLIDRRRMMLEFDIDDKMSQVFWQWATYFAKEYVGSGKIEQYVRPMKMLSVDDMVQKNRRESMLFCSLYYDLGDGYSEEQKLYREIAMDGEHFSVSFSLGALQQALSKEGKKIVRLRFDPLEGALCACHIQESTVRLTAYNHVDDYEEWKIFLNLDPVYLSQEEEIPETVVIKGKIHRFTDPQLAAYLAKKMPLWQWQGSDSQESMVMQQKEIDRLREELQEKAAAFDQLLSEKQNVDAQYSRLIDDFQKLETEYKQAVKEIEEIHASRSWKLLNKLKGN